MKCLALVAVLAGCSALPISNSERIQAAGNVWQFQSPNSRGSGMPVGVQNGNLIFLTAAHLEMFWPGEWDVMSKDGIFLTGGVVIERCPDQDAMLVAFPIADDFELPPLHRLNFAPLEFGEEVYGAGWGGGWGLWLTEGLVSDANRVTSPISPGDSGGGLFNDEGELIAILVGRGPDAHHAWVVPLSDLDGWLIPLLTRR